ncbi:MAG: hypothetical protein LBT11_02145 [Treponema sp.]|jgi:hypothetical protein|nr:hypothetical protein [Treponema sp.]
MAGQGGSFQMPPIVYVGDPGRLVVPLGREFAGVPATVIVNPEPGAAGTGAWPGGLEISRIELEPREDGARLLVDFRAYAPGTHALPDIEIASLSFKGLELHVASILEAGGQAMVLSGPLAPLAVPGSLGLVYAAVIGFVLLIAGGAFMGRWGLPGLRRLRARRKRRRTIRGAGKRLDRLREGLGEGGGGAAALDGLSSEFRTLLSFLSGVDCQSLVPREFAVVPALAEGYGPDFYGEIFRRCDTLRFSGGEPPRAEALELLERVRAFISLLEPAPYTTKRPRALEAQHEFDL